MTSYAEWRELDRAQMERDRERFIQTGPCSHYETIYYAYPVDSKPGVWASVNFSRLECDRCGMRWGYEELKDAPMPHAFRWEESKPPESRWTAAKRLYAGT